VLQVLRQIGRLVLSHGLLLAAIYLAGALARYLLIEGIGFVGAYTAVGGALLFPLIMLAQLVPLVSMLLVLRDGLVQLGLVAPLPDDRRARRRAFADSLLGSVLAFVVFYAAWGYLRDDAAAYFSRVLQVNQGLIAQEILLGMEREGDGAAGDLTLGPITIGIVVAAFALRWAYGRYRERLPRGWVVGAVYLEALWIVLSALLLSQLLSAVGQWMASRQAMAWLGQLRSWVDARVEPVAWIWDGVEWFLGEAGGILLQPLAWLAIAGVVYGYAASAQPIRMQHRLIDATRARYERIPGWMRSRLRDVGAQFTGRFRPIWNALTLMWRAGPVLIGCYVLLFTVVLAIESLVGIAVTRLIGPQHVGSFWMPYSTLVYLVVPLLVEPLRMITVAAGYDATVGRLRQRAAVST